MSESLSLEQVDKYVSQHGVVCIYCGSQNVFGALNLATSEDGNAIYRCHCKSCEKRWSDLYELRGVVDEDGKAFISESSLEKGIVDEWIQNN